MDNDKCKGGFFIPLWLIKDGNWPFWKLILISSLVFAAKDPYVQGNIKIPRGAYLATIKQLLNTFRQSWPKLSLGWLIHNLNSCREHNYIKIYHYPSNGESNIKKPTKRIIQWLDADPKNDWTMVIQIVDYNNYLPPCSLTPSPVAMEGTR